MRHEDTLEATIRGRRLANGSKGRNLRVRVGLSLREAARLAGVSPSPLTRWERGLSKPVRGGAAARWAQLADRIEAVLAEERETTE